MKNGHGNKHTQITSLPLVPDHRNYAGCNVRSIAVGKIHATSNNKNF